MARLQPSVVPLSPSDAARLAELWVERRVESGSPREAARRAVDEGLFADAIGRPYVVMLLAVLDGEVVGYAWVCTHSLTPHMDTPSLGIEDMYVVPERRGRGVGRALLVAVAGYAQKRGVDLVGCAVPAQDKDVNRSLTRIGFGTLTTRRVAQAAVVLRKLRGSDTRGVVDQTLLQRRRRAMRERCRPEVLAVSS